jgi:hypothetical protein
MEVEAAPVEVAEEPMKLLILQSQGCTKVKKLYKTVRN